MELESITEAIAGRADDFLEGASNRAQARAGVYELINADYPQLPPSDRDSVAARVMEILEREGFFDAVPGGGAVDPMDAGEE